MVPCTVRAWQYILLDTLEFYKLRSQGSNNYNIAASADIIKSYEENLILLEISFQN